MNVVISHQGKDLGEKYLKKRDAHALGQITRVERKREESRSVKTCFV